VDGGERPAASYWRSLEDLSRTPGNEALRAMLADAIAIPPDPNLNRRRFLAVMAASLSAAGVGCGRFEDRGTIAGSAALAEGDIPGTPRYYASTLVHYPGCFPVIATVRDGRVVKLEGNSEHPASMGALGAFGQASTLDLYDPDRLRAPLLNGKDVSWEEADQLVRNHIESSSRAGKFTVLVTGPVVSPTAHSLLRLFTSAYPKTIHRILATLHDGERSGGRQLAFGTPGAGTIRWDLADVILSVDCDFLGSQGQPGDERAFSARRRPEAGAPVNRLWAVEAGLTLTGSNADHRFPLRPVLQPAFLAWLLGEVVLRRKVGPLAADGALTGLLRAALQGIAPSDFGMQPKATAALIDDLVKSQGRSAIIAGPQLPTSCHVLVAALNVTLGNEGTTVLPVLTRPGTDASTLQEWAEAAELMNRDRVGVLIALDANPVYSLPEFDIAHGLTKVPFVVSSSLLRDETASAAHLVLPAAHDLESWGDCDAHPNLLSIQQPAMRPVSPVRQSEESLLSWLGKDERPTPNYREYLKLRWTNEVYPPSGAAADFVRFWEAALHDGFVDIKTEALPSSTLSIPEVLDAVGRSTRKPDHGFDLVLCPSPRLHDGRFANNGWLQELPHPVTTQAWGNAAVVGPATAAALDCREGQTIRIKAGGASLDLPILVGPGVADKTVLVDLGYGRRAGGSVGTHVGFDAGRLRSPKGGVSAWLYTGVRLVAVRNREPIIRVQQHDMAEGRAFIKEATAHGTLLSVATTEHPHPPESNWEYNGHKWGLVIDLSACTGCGACTIACVAENNIPVVGPEQVAKGREMHWIRIDRYFSGPVANPAVAYQPMMCQQCDCAPCEKVCPVAATVHSPEGLDEMVYNRCVGTRYCANNCPYKVRRFNYLDYHQEVKSPKELVFNPEVTVRSRGVMEKCTFCVQRIAAGKQAARAAGRKLADGDIRTACQQACPTGAIVFGDLNDPESRVHKLAGSERGYRALEELGIGPAVRYLARIRNPHSGLKI